MRTEAPAPRIHGADEVIRIQLTEEQAEQLAPVVTAAAARSENVLFFALAVPFWRDGNTIWELQTLVIPARIGHKIIKLVRSDGKPVIQKGGHDGTR